jgi:hypothetical protein
VHGNVSDLVGVVFDCFDLLRRIVVENPQESVVCSDNDPLFAWDKFCRTHWGIRYLKGAHLSLGVPVVNCDATCVKRNEHPGQRWMQVHALDSVRPIRKLLFYV